MPKSLVSSAYGLHLNYSSLDVCSGGAEAPLSEILGCSVSATQLLGLIATVCNVS